MRTAQSPYSFSLNYPCLFPISLLLLTRSQLSRTTSHFGAACLGIKGIMKCLEIRVNIGIGNNVSMRKRYVSYCKAKVVLVRISD